MNHMSEPTRRAEGLPAGSGAMPIDPWPLRPLNPADELPGRLSPMSVLPPPVRSLPRRILSATCSLGSTIAAGASLILLAQYLTTP
jgi:hypothetical protein